LTAAFTFAIRAVDICALAQVGIGPAKSRLVKASGSQCFRPDVHDNLPLPIGTNVATHINDRADWLADCDPYQGCETPTSETAPLQPVQAGSRAVLASPHEARRRYQTMSRMVATPYLGPDEWERLAPSANG
jgi:hypothetical protein